MKPKIGKDSRQDAAAIAQWINLHCLGHAMWDGRGRLDADETNMLALALEQMRTRVYEAEYPELKGRMILPVASDIDPAAETFAYESTDWVGSAKILSGNGYADDPPTAETKSSKHTHPVLDLGGGYIYTLADIRRAAFSGRPLEARKAIAARRAYENKLDEIIAVGAPTESGGLINYGITNYPMGTSDGQIRKSTPGDSADWAAATADGAGMVSDLLKAVKDFVLDSKETQAPTTLVLPTAQYLLAMHTQIVDASGRRTVAEEFLKTNGYVREILSWNKLKAVDGSSGNNSRGLLLNKDADVAEVVIPMEFTVQAPQPQNWAFKVLAMGRTAGACIYRPLGMRYIEDLPVE